MVSQYRKRYMVPEDLQVLKELVFIFNQAQHRPRMYAYCFISNELLWHQLLLLCYNIILVSAAHLQIWNFFILHLTPSTVEKDLPNIFLQPSLLNSRVGKGVVFPVNLNVIRIMRIAIFTTSYLYNVPAWPYWNLGVLNMSILLMNHLIMRLLL